MFWGMLLPLANPKMAIAAPMLPPVNKGIQFLHSAIMYATKLLNPLLLASARG
jgi:hypothetical protein